MKRLLVVLRVAIVTALVMTLTVTPASAISFSDTHTMTYSTDYSYASPLDLCPLGPPCSLRIVAESDLRAGYSGSQICVVGGQVGYRTTVTSWMVLKANWDPNATVQESITAGDTLTIPGNANNVVVDTDADGNPGPKDDYIISFGSMVYGRSATINYAYGLAYPTGTCTSDGYSTSTFVQSRAVSGEVHS